MKTFRVLAPALAAAALLAGCGGATPGNQTSAAGYTKLVSFGDSLSDVGTYGVGVVSGLYKSRGYYSVNGIKTDGATYTNWTEFLSAQLGLAAPCPAETGLNTIPGIFPGGFGPVPVVEHPECTNYAQGGARVTELAGPGNVALFDPNDPSTYGNALGQLTKPIGLQIQAHLDASGGSFAATDLVTVLAGGNDALIQLESLPQKIAAYAAAFIAAGDDVATATAKATAQAGAEAVTAMGTEGANLAVDINTKIIANGATHVIVVNLPDLSKTPLGYSLDAATQGLVATMVDTFNAQLTSGLAASAANVVIVDSAASTRDQAVNPAAYGLTNNNTPACDATKVGTSLFCTAGTVIAGDVSHYEFADDVHPTPFTYKLLAQLVSERMAVKGWL